MSRKRYTAEQIIGHLRQAEIRTSEGKTIAEAVRELGISEQTYYRWRKQYGGMEVTCPPGMFPFPELGFGTQQGG